MKKINGIKVIVPTRSSGGIRSVRIKKMLDSYENTKKHKNTSIVLGLDKDDHMYYNLYKNSYQHIIMPRKRFVSKINTMSRGFVDEYDFLFFLGDDQVFLTPGWDQIFIDEAKKFECACILYPEDNNPNNDLPTSVFISSNIIEKVGYMAPPSLVHMYADNFWKDIGNELSILKKVDQVIVDHQHGFLGKAPIDRQYYENDSYMNQDRISYNLYLKNYFIKDINKIKQLL